MKGTRNLWISIAFVGLLVLASIAGFATGLRPLLGLDLKGGLSVILTAPPGTPKDVMNQAADNIRNRVDALGVSDAQISVSGQNIQVEIASTGKGKISPVSKSQYCLIGQVQKSYGCATKQTDAQTTLSGISVTDQVSEACLSGKGGTSYGCFSSTTALKDADAALRAMSVQKQGTQFCVTENAAPAPTPSPGKAKHTPAPTPSVAPTPSPSPTPAPTPTGGATLPCEKTQKSTQSQLSALAAKATQQRFCLTGKSGSNLDCAFTSQTQANGALASIKVVHETTQYCVTGPDGKSLGCFVSPTIAQDALNTTGQAHILATIGQTARLEMRQVVSSASGAPNPIPPSDPHYATTPLTCPNGTSSPGCTYDQLKSKPVTYYGPATGGAKPPKYQLGPVLVPGSDIAKATAVYQTSGGSATSFQQTGWQVDFTLTPAGSTTFGDVTTRLQGQQLAIALDQKVISAPTINAAITNGSGIITGSFTSQRAKDLATVLNAGALPVDLTRNSVQTISPTLGAQSLHQGLIAGIVGLILLALYLAFYYRLLGVVTWLGMSIWATFALALIALAGRTIGYSLSLAGIAGVIVSMGITADSYIVFYERLKDEVRHGKTPRSAIAPAFKRAWRTIVAADIVTMLAAAVLYVLAIGSVRGFALTLGLSTALDLLVVYFFKRPTVFLIARSPKLTNMHGFGLTSGVAAEPEQELARVGGGSR